VRLQRPKSPHASFQTDGRRKSGCVALGSQAIASEHHNYQGPFKKVDRATLSAIQRSEYRTVDPRAWAGRLIDLDTTLPVLSQLFEPVRDIDKQALEKISRAARGLYSRHSSDRQIRSIGAPPIQR
jgi:hypothetical protein